MNKLETFTEEYFFKSNRDSNAIWFLTNKDVKTMSTKTNKSSFILSVEYTEI